MAKRLALTLIRVIPPSPRVVDAASRSGGNSITKWRASLIPPGKRSDDARSTRHFQGPGRSERGSKRNEKVRARESQRAAKVPQRASSPVPVAAAAVRSVKTSSRRIRQIGWLKSPPRNGGTVVGSGPRSRTSVSSDPASPWVSLCLQISTGLPAYSTRAPLGDSNSGGSPPVCALAMPAFKSRGTSTKMGSSRRTWLKSRHFAAVRVLEPRPPPSRPGADDVCTDLARAAAELGDDRASLPHLLVLGLDFCLGYENEPLPGFHCAPGPDADIY